MYKIFENDGKYNIVINNTVKKTYDKQNKESIYNYLIKFVNHLIKAKVKNDHFKLIGIFIMYDKYNIIKRKELFLTLKEKKYNLNFIIYIKIFGFVLAIYNTKIPYNTLLDLDIHNKLFICYIDDNNYGMKKGWFIKYMIIRRGVIELQKWKFLKISILLIC